MATYSRTLTPGPARASKRFLTSSILYESRLTSVRDNPGYSICNQPIRAKPDRIEQRRPKIRAPDPNVLEGREEVEKNRYIDWRCTACGCFLGCRGGRLPWMAAKSAVISSLVSAAKALFVGRAAASGGGCPPHAGADAFPEASDLDASSAEVLGARGLQRGRGAREGGLLRVLVRRLLLVPRRRLRERRRGRGAAAVLGAAEANRWGWRPSGEVGRSGVGDPNNVSRC